MSWGRRRRGARGRDVHLGGLELKVANGQITPIFIRLIKHAVALHALEGVVEGCLRPCPLPAAARLGGNKKFRPPPSIAAAPLSLYVCVM
jgi:hypothetical protein